jgi:mitofilin
MTLICSLTNQADQLSVQEVNNMLVHAHRRVSQLQKQINRIQSSQTANIQAALDAQRSQLEQAQADSVNSALDVAKREFDLEKEVDRENAKIAMYENLKRELSRQAAAHNMHLGQMLKQQEDELQSLYEKYVLWSTWSLPARY